MVYVNYSFFDRVADDVIRYANGPHSPTAEAILRRLDPSVVKLADFAGIVVWSCHKFFYLL